MRGEEKNRASKTSCGQRLEPRGGYEKNLVGIVEMVYTVKVERPVERNQKHSKSGSLCVSISSSFNNSGQAWSGTWRAIDRAAEVCISRNPTALRVPHPTAPCSTTTDQHREHSITVRSSNCCFRCWRPEINASVVYFNPSSKMA